MIKTFSNFQSEIEILFNVMNYYNMKIFICIITNFLSHSNMKVWMFDINNWNHWYNIINNNCNWIKKRILNWILYITTISSTTIKNKNYWYKKNKQDYFWKIIKKHDKNEFYVEKYKYAKILKI